MSDELLNAEQLADRFGVSKPTLLEWARQYQWPRVLVGRKSYWTPEHVEQILRRHEVSGGAVAPRDGRTTRSARRSA